MSTFQLIIIGVALLTASTVQGTIGFGAALILLSMLLMAGLSLPQSITLLIVATTFSNIVGIWRLHNELKWKEVIKPISIRLVCLLIGFALLPLIENLNRSQLKQMFGGLLVVILLVQLFVKVKPKENLHEGWEWLAVSSSGVMQGAVGIGGPPLVLWLMAKPWSHKRNRAYMFYLFMAASIPHYILMCFHPESEIIQTTIIGLVFMPLILVGTMIGVWLGNKLDARVARIATYSFLFLLAANMIFDPFQMQQIASTR